MDEYIMDLSQTKLFAGIEPQEIAGLLDCIRGRYVEYGKSNMIIEEGDRIDEFGVMLSGNGRAIKWDASDSLIIISLLGRGSEIGVLLAASEGYESSVFVQAQDDVSVLLIPYDGILSWCGKNCSKHKRLIRNYIGIVAEKGLMLHERIDCLLRPTLRDKILNYLFRVSREQQNRTFTIPMNRNAMSQYLNIERSALSRELSHMRRDGIIDYHRSSFKLIDKT